MLPEVGDWGGNVDLVSWGTSAELSEISARLRADPALRWRDGDELLEAARSAIRRAEAVAPQWFSALPPQSCDVRPVPEAEADGGTIGCCFPPALDGSRPGTYFANTYKAHERFRHTSEAIAFHEAVPGHHFQLSTALELTDLSRRRRAHARTGCARRSRPRRVHPGSCSG